MSEKGPESSSTNEKNGNPTVSNNYKYKEIENDLICQFEEAETEKEKIEICLKMLFIKLIKVFGNLNETEINITFDKEYKKYYLKDLGENMVGLTDNKDFSIIMNSDGEILKGNYENIPNIFLNIFDKKFRIFKTSYEVSTSLFGIN